MSSRHKHRRSEARTAACPENAIVRCGAATNESAPAESHSPAPLREVCPVLEPWAVDEAVCSNHDLPAHEAIAARAREIWELRGKPAGADLDIWLEAQAQFVSVAH